MVTVDPAVSSSTKSIESEYCWLYEVAVTVVVNVTSLSQKTFSKGMVFLPKSTPEAPDIGTIVLNALIKVELILILSSPS